MLRCGPSIKGFLGVLGMAIKRSVAGIEDLNAYKDQASDGNE